MSSVARLSDVCTGHEDFPPRSNTSASQTVFINGLGAHRSSDSWAQHCNSSSCHESLLQAGSGTVFVEGLQLGRVGDQIACGSTIATGSDNVFAGD